MFSDASLAEKELNWKAERGLDEMCKLNFGFFLREAAQPTHTSVC